MSDLSKLFDESSYSEGDPVRQLLAAGKAAREWPTDALAWGADLVDMGSAGLAKIFQRRPELANAIRTNLGGNLRTAIRGEKYGGEPSIYERPAQDTEDARTVGRLLNPLLLLNFKIPTDISRVSKSSSLPAIIEESKPAIESVSRRDFMKKSAGIAGGTAAASIPGAKLLQKFAPEEKEIAAKAIPKEWASVEGGAHRYHSLADYLADIERSVYPNTIEKADKLMKERLLQDEAAYREAKRNLSSLNPKKDFNTGLPPQSQRDLIDSFSPQAKKEMKEFKSLTKQIDTDYTGSHDWTQWVIKNSEDPTKIIEELKKWYIP